MSIQPQDRSKKSRLPPVPQESDIRPPTPEPAPIQTQAIPVVQQPVPQLAEPPQPIQSETSPEPEEFSWTSPGTIAIIVGSILALIMAHSCSDSIVKERERTSESQLPPPASQSDK